MCEIKAMLDDDISKKEFDAIVNFRKTLDINYLSDFDLKIESQYFENFLVEKNYQYLIDGGAYDGHDTLRFCSIYPSYSSVVICEPSKKNRSLIKEKLHGLSNIEVKPVCLGKEHRWVNFSENGMASCIGNQGFDVEILNPC